MPPLCAVKEKRGSTPAVGLLPPLQSPQTPWSTCPAPAGWACIHVPPASCCCCRPGVWNCWGNQLLVQGRPLEPAGKSTSTPLFGCGQYTCGGPSRLVAYHQRSSGVALWAQLRTCGGECWRRCQSPSGTAWSCPHPPGRGDSCGRPWGRPAAVRWVWIIRKQGYKHSVSLSLSVFFPVTFTKISFFPFLGIRYFYFYIKIITLKFGKAILFLCCFRISCSSTFKDI